MFENGHITLCYVMLNKYAGENIVRLHADKKGRIIGTIHRYYFIDY